MLMLVGTSLVAGVLAWGNLQSTVESNATLVQSNIQMLEKKSTKFLVDQEFTRVADELNDHEDQIEELEDRVDSLSLSDERVNAKIELEVEKLRNEIQPSAQEQQLILQQILNEVQE